MCETRQDERLGERTRTSVPSASMSSEAAPGVSTDPPRTLPMIGLIGVELTITSISFCGWCDTAIARHTPRVVRRYYVGEKTQDEFMHASCAFHFDDGSWLRHGGRVHSDCAGCAAHIDIDQPRAVSLFSHKPPKPRWTPAAGCRPLSFCFPCVRSFVERHGGLLDGYVSAQQMAAPVAWRHAKTHSPFNPAVGQCEGEPCQRTPRAVSASSASFAESARQRTRRSPSSGTRRCAGGSRSSSERGRAGKTIGRRPRRSSARAARKVVSSAPDTAPSRTQSRTRPLHLILDRTPPSLDAEWG